MVNDDGTRLELVTPTSLPPAPSKAAPQVIAAFLKRPRIQDLGRALLYSAPALLIFTLFTYVPFIRAIWLSLHVTNNVGETVRFNGLDYYIRILGLDGRTDGLESLITSFQFALMVVPTGIIIALALALLATVRVRGIGIFRTIFTSSIAISLASAGVIWALIYSPSTKATEWLVRLLQLETPSLLGSDSTALAAVALVTIWSGIGFSFIVTLAGIQAIPHDYTESARIDGANRWQIFRHITLPLLSPTLMFLVVINTIGSLQAFTQFHLLIPEKYPSVFVYSTYRAFWYDTRYGYASAMSIVLFVILLTLTLVQYRVINRRVHYQ